EVFYTENHIDCKKWYNQRESQEFKFLPSCRPVERSRLINIFRHGLKTGDINNRIHCNRLPCTDNHYPNPCCLFIGKHTSTQCSASYRLSEFRKDVCKEIVEDVTDYQRSQYIRKEVSRSEKTLTFNLAIEPKCKNQTDDIGNDRSTNGKTKCKPVGFADSCVGEKIRVIPKTYHIVVSK